MKLFICIVGLLCPFILSAQVITGRVTNDKKQPLKGASVQWAGTTKGVSTDDKGFFSLDAAGMANRILVASFVGHLPDSLVIVAQTQVVFVLKEDQDVEQVTISRRRESIINANLSPMKIEQLTGLELAKAPCCDLAGCFETQLTVQPQTTNVVTNSKELRILGLSGVYNQVLIDGLPMIHGLAYTYGISSIPGTLVNNIYISKGANSVIQGYESISGQINVETKKPDHTDQLLLNLYMNSFKEKHVNLNFSAGKKKWSNITSFQTVQPADRTDGDNDNFMDLPLLTRYMVYNRTKYGREANWGLHATMGLRFLNEERIGGQMAYMPASHKGGLAVYGQHVRVNQPEISAKTGFRFNDTHHLVVYGSSFYQRQQSFFGTARYEADQLNVYANLQHEFTYGANNLKSGISFRYVVLDETISFSQLLPARTYAGNYGRQEQIPGIFTENTMNFLEGNLTWIAGVRADNHNEFGTIFTPRTLIKYNISPSAVIRGNIGTGWRTVNLFSENINLLASSRDIILAEALRPEKAVNMGVNFTQKFDMAAGDFSGSLSFDFYHTNFQNQIFPDYDADPTKAIVRNFMGKSISNGFQTELYLKIINRFEVKTGYSYLDVYQQTGTVKNVLPFNPKHKVLSTVSYKPLTDKFHFDMNIHWYGMQRLPNTSSNPLSYQRPDFSESYTTASAQFTYKFGQLEVYTGAENIFNFRQHQPIISWQDPFSPYFDTSSVWGPTRGRELYLGLRYTIAKK